MISESEPHQKTDLRAGDLEHYKTQEHPPSRCTVACGMETSSSPSSRRARSPLYGKMPTVDTWLLDCGCAHSRTLASIIPTSSPLPPRSWNAKSAGCAVVLATRPCPPTFRTMDHAGRPPSWRAGGPFAILNIPRLPALLSAFQPSSLLSKNIFGYTFV